jgi:hypothetical protein
VRCGFGGEAVRERDAADERWLAGALFDGATGPGRLPRTTVSIDRLVMTSSPFTPPTRGDKAIGR